MHIAVKVCEAVPLIVLYSHKFYFVCDVYETSYRSNFCQQQIICHTMSFFADNKFEKLWHERSGATVEFFSVLPIAQESIPHVSILNPIPIPCTPLQHVGYIHTAHKTLRQQSTYFSSCCLYSQITNISVHGFSLFLHLTTNFFC